MYQHSPHMSSVLAERFHEAIEVVPDFPKPGILFRNVLSAFAQRGLLQELVYAMCEPYRGIRRQVAAVVGIESRGFIGGAMMADLIGCGFVAARKAEKGHDGAWYCKLPGQLDIETYDLEYGQAALALQHGAFGPGDKVIVWDDLLATGGTAAAAGRLVTKQGADVISYDFAVELAALGGRKRLLPYAIANSPTAGFHALLAY
jgi:adenine phosphoribosyltransferase